MTDPITEARELCDKATPGPWMGLRAAYEDCLLIKCDEDEYLMSQHDVAFVARSRTLVEKLCDALEKANAQIESIHKSLDFAETQRQKSKNYTELAINNGLALGRIAVTIQHDFGPLPAAPEED